MDSSKKCATTIISLDPNNEKSFSILAIKGHANSQEAAAYIFDEILRNLNDCAVDNKVVIESFDDNYGELCFSISCNDNEKVIVKTLYEGE